MLLSTVVHINSFRYVLPAIFMLGVAPQYFLAWLAWRSVTWILPHKFFQIGDDFMYSLYQRLILFFFENTTGVQILFYGEVEELFKKKENIIYISNHQSTVDWIVADMLAVRQGSLGHIRYILKDGLKFLPLYGYYFYQHGCIYVKRGGNFQQTRMETNLAYTQKEKLPLWLIIFPEGTRYNPDLKSVIEKSQNFAKDQGLSVLQHLLTPKTKALQLSLNYLRSQIDAIYNVTIAYSDTFDEKKQKRLTAPPMADFLSGKCSKLHIHVKRINISDVPTDETDIKEWLHKLFIEKDRLMCNFYSSNPNHSGQFEGKCYQIPLGLQHTLPAVIIWTIVALPIFFSEDFRSIYWRTWVFGSLATCLYMTIRSVA